MCDPMTMAVASFAIGAAQSVASFSAQSAAADEQNRLYEQNRLNAIAAFEDNQRALTNRQSQEQEAAGAQKFDNAIEARKARALNRVAAGESGVSGITVESLMRDMYQQEARVNDRVDQNTDWTMAQLQDQKRGDGYRTLDRINSVQRANKPSFVDLGLKLAGAGLNSAASYRQWNK